jgi:hypothetical protein
MPELKHKNSPVVDLRHTAFNRRPINWIDLHDSDSRRHPIQT